jgi:hypothetical protein
VTTLQIVFVAVISASLATAAVGFALGHLVEIRLKAMRDLFGMALVQRESFDAALRSRDERIDHLGERIDIVRTENENRDREHQDHERRLKRLEGHGA